nr:hypothetical protein BaRGS_028376 [Batillaria attramentaria]
MLALSQQKRLGDHTDRRSSSVNPECIELYPEVKHYIKLPPAVPGADVPGGIGGGSNNANNTNTTIPSGVGNSNPVSVTSNGLNGP